MKKNSARGTPKPPGSLIVFASPPLRVAGELITRLRGRLDAATGTGQQWYMPPRVITESAQAQAMGYMEPGVDYEFIPHNKFSQMQQGSLFICARGMMTGYKVGISRDPLLAKLKSGERAVISVSIPEIYGIRTFVGACSRSFRQPLPVRIVTLVPVESDESTIRRYVTFCGNGTSSPLMEREIKTQIDWLKKMPKGDEIQLITFSLAELMKAQGDRYECDQFIDDLFTQLLSYVPEVVSGSPIPTS